jgi:hypothetical protein
MKDRLQEMKTELKKFSFENDETAHHDNERKIYFSKIKNELN